MSGQGRVGIVVGGFGKIGNAVAERGGLNMEGGEKKNGGKFYGGHEESLK
jgi:hypothetical protein